MTPPAAPAATQPHLDLTHAPAFRQAGGPKRTIDARQWGRLRVLFDAVVLTAATLCSIGSGTSRFSADPLICLGFPLVMLAVLALRPRPEEQLSGSIVDGAMRVGAVASGIGMVSLASGYLLGLPHVLPLVLRLWVYSVAYLAVSHLAVRSLHRRLVATGVCATPTLIVGAGVVGDRLARHLLARPEYGLQPVGLIDESPLRNGVAGSGRVVPVLGGPRQLLEMLVETGARRVLVAFSTEPDASLIGQLEACRRMGIDVSLVPRMFELMNSRSSLDHVGGLPLITVRPTDPRDWQFAFKHTLDRAVAATLLAVLAPLLALIAVGVLVSSPGPIFFRQRRVGRDGREFDLLKFRTMGIEPQPTDFELPAGLAPGGVEGVDRRTPIGRILRASSVDELPQLINVLRGEMSIVGPRPERPEFVALFSSEIDRYERRHRVKAGITGWAQVCGLRGQTSIVDRVEWDNFYIQNWSLRLDFRILALTAAEILRFRG